MTELKELLVGCFFAVCIIASFLGASGLVAVLLADLAGVLPLR